ncbi:Dyp-type peroxidase [Neisseria leonii]|uniref:Dyp-type peroxidase n=1 Tax=Neisseria leonii TaxID=2995413 RepID=UPI00237AD477|nr:Dyp-type peroxidase [Neisseria sp. 3986]MDD9324990.1 Dyp-type peroxidase [Neisseria sp. 3986]
MNTPQSAIIPDHGQAAVFIEADTAAQARGRMAQHCRNALDELSKLQARFPDGQLGMTIAFGADFWHSLGHGGEGGGIKPFAPLGGGLCPATQCDLMIHIQSARHAVNFALAQAVLTVFGGDIKVQNETHAFRLLEDRGMDGFVDGTENPQGEGNIRRVGVIAEGADAGGSYVLLQRYLHDLDKWQALGVAGQEAAVGRSKADNEEFAKDVRLPESHLGRTNLKENGEGLKIVRRSLPFGTLTGEHGLQFIAYCARLHNIEAQLKHMFGETDGKIDLLLTHMSTVQRSAYYYAPSVERLRRL